LGQRNPKNLGGKGKTPVFAMVERGGKVRSMVMDRVTIANLRKALTDNVHPSARLMNGLSESLRLCQQAIRVAMSRESYERGDVIVNALRNGNCYSVHHHRAHLAATFYHREYRRLAFAAEILWVALTQRLILLSAADERFISLNNAVNGSTEAGSSSIAKRTRCIRNNADL